MPVLSDQPKLALDCNCSDHPAQPLTKNKKPVNGNNHGAVVKDIHCLNKFLMYLAGNYCDGDNSCTSPGGVLLRYTEILDNILDNISRYLYNIILKTLLHMALQRG